MRKKLELPKLFVQEAGGRMAAAQLRVEDRGYGHPRLVLQWWGGRPQRRHLGTMVSVAPLLADAGARAGKR